MLRRGLALKVWTDPAWQIVAVADVNGDGHPDLLRRQAAASDVGVWFMDGTMSFGGAPLTRVAGTK